MQGMDPRCMIWDCQELQLPFVVLRREGRLGEEWGVEEREGESSTLVLPAVVKWNNQFSQHLDAAFLWLITVVTAPSTPVPS